MPDRSCKTGSLQGAILLVLLVSGCSTPRVQSIGPQQYEITGDATQMDEKATDTCAKLGREVLMLPMPAGGPADRFRFECVKSYEVVAAEGALYRIRVLANDIQVKHFVIPPSNGIPAHIVWAPDEDPARKEARQRATDYCGKMHRALKMTDEKFEAGSGLNLTFQCVAPP
jgi:hypothetical protein